jgi:putative transposase
MSRPLRIAVDGGVYHVISRGNDRNAIFQQDADRLHFCDLLAEMRERFRLLIHAYVLMDNHFHLIVSTPHANLSQAMQWFKTSYSMWYNTRYNRIGPLFQGRFKSVLVDPGEDWLLELSYYIHLNPVRIKKYGLSKKEQALESKGWKAPTREEVRGRMKQLRTYPWSSYAYYGGYRRKVPEWLDIRDIQSRCPRNAIYSYYREEMRTRITSGHNPDFVEGLKSSLAIGREDFVDEVRNGIEGVDREVAGKRELQDLLDWNSLIAVAEEVKGEKWEVFGRRYGDPGRAVVFCLAKRYSGMTLKEIGERAGGVDYAAVSDMIRRYEKKDVRSEIETRMRIILNIET